MRARTRDVASPARAGGARRTLAAAALALAAAALAFAAAPARAAWRPDRFTIGGFRWTDPADPASRRDPLRLLRLHEAGVNLVVSGGWYDSTEARASARLLDSLRGARPGFDLRVVVDYRLPANPGIVTYHPRAAAALPAVARTLDPAWGANNRAVEGWLVWDEPRTAADFENAGRIAALVDSLPVSRGKLPYVNLLPLYGMDDPEMARRRGLDRAAAYRGYLEDYAALWTRHGRPVPLLSVDHYPFQVRQARQDLCLNLELVRACAERHAHGGRPVPVWFVAQCSAYRPPRGAGSLARAAPGDAEVRWPVFAALAYGAKGILWWTLGPAERDGFGPGLLDRRGRPTARRAFLAGLNAELAHLGRRLLDLDAVGVWHQRPAPGEGLEAWRLDAPGRPRGVLAGLEGGGGDGVVGHLRHADTGEDWLLVVNRSLRTRREFTVRLARTAAAVERVSPATGRLERVATGAGRFSTPRLAPGAGALYRIVR